MTGTQIFKVRESTDLASHKRMLAVAKFEALDGKTADQKIEALTALARELVVAAYPFAYEIDR